MRVEAWTWGDTNTGGMECRRKGTEKDVSEKSANCNLQAGNQFSLLRVYDVVTRSHSEARY